jgi:hypothetical protein
MSTLNINIIACVVFGCLCYLHLWENEWDADGDCFFSWFFWFSALTIPALVRFFVPIVLPEGPIAFLNLYQSSPSAAARERQSAEVLEDLKRTLEASHQLVVAAKDRQLKHQHETITSNQQRLQAWRRAHDAVVKEAARQSGLRTDLEGQLFYAKQRIDEEDSTALMASAEQDKKALEVAVASLQKAQEELAELKSARALSVVPAVPAVPAIPVVTPAADLAAHTVCEHQGLLAEKATVESQLASERRESSRLRLALASHKAFLAQKGVQLANKDAELEGKVVVIAALHSRYAIELAAAVEKQKRVLEGIFEEGKKGLSEKHVRQVAEEVREKFEELDGKYLGEVEAEVSKQVGQLKKTHDVQLAAEADKQLAATTSHQEAVHKMAAEHSDRITKLEEEHKVQLAAARAPATAVSAPSNGPTYHNPPVPRLSAAPAGATYDPSCPESWLDPRLRATAAPTTVPAPVATVAPTSLPAHFQQGPLSDVGEDEYESDGDDNLARFAARPDDDYRQGLSFPSQAAGHGEEDGCEEPLVWSDDEEFTVVNQVLK